MISAYALALACADMSLGCAASTAALDNIEALKKVEGSLAHWEPAPSEAIGLGNAHRYAITARTITPAEA